MQEFVFSLRGGKGAWIDSLGLNSYASGFPTGGVKRFEVLISTQARPTVFASLGFFSATATTEANRTTIQRFPIAPVYATHVKLRTLSNHGNPT